MAKIKPPFNQEMAIRGANRRLFARSPAVFDKLNASRQEFPRYKKDGTLAKKPWVKRQCEVCGAWVSSTKIAIDHIDPVVPPEGFPDHFDMWDRINLFLKRLWCDVSNLQRICDDCHDAKTQKERIARLLTKYHQELDEIHTALPAAAYKKTDKIVTPFYSGPIGKLLSKYTAKKKTLGLETVVERALKMKEKLK